eukprot:COSAG01_NODE_8232_length_2862_cov_15.949330_5_plen_63_part_00
MAGGARLDELVELSKGLSPNFGMEAGADYGPMVTPAAKERCEGLITSAVRSPQLPAAGCQLT